MKVSAVSIWRRTSRPAAQKRPLSWQRCRLLGTLVKLTPRSYSLEIIEEFVVNHSKFIQLKLKKKKWVEILVIGHVIQVLSVTSRRGRLMGGVNQSVTCPGWLVRGTLMSSADNSVARGQESSSASSAFVSPFSGFFRAPMPESLRVGALRHLRSRAHSSRQSSAEAFFSFISFLFVSTANNFFVIRLISRFHTPFDSALKALLKVFWVESNSILNSVASGGERGEDYSRRRHWFHNKFCN